MSGGSHNYICDRMRNELCGKMYDPLLDELVEDLCKVAHDLEWADSADITHEKYFNTVREFKEKWFHVDGCKEAIITMIKDRIKEDENWFKTLGSFFPLDSSSVPKKDIVEVECSFCKQHIPLDRFYILSEQFGGILYAKCPLCEHVSLIDPNDNDKAEAL